MFNSSFFFMLKGVINPANPSEEVPNTGLAEAPHY